jgi:hypothetical protein
MGRVSGTMTTGERRCQEDIRRLSGWYQETVGGYQKIVRMISCDWQEDIRRFSGGYQEIVGFISGDWQKDIRRLSVWHG